MAGLVLGIAGANQAVNSGTFTISTLMKVSVTIFLAIAGILTLMMAYLTCFVHRMTYSERIVLSSIYVCTPLLIVRVIYAALGDFGTDPRFRIYSGDETINLVMSVLEEIVITIILLAIGLAYPMPRKDIVDQPGMARLSSQDPIKR